MEGSYSERREGKGRKERDLSSISSAPHMAMMAGRQG